MQSLYFTFLDGAFSYDCPSCGQACCRGKGVAIDAGRELVPLLRRAPQVASLLSPLTGGYVRLPDLTDGCWFLQRDGLCAYEGAHGRDAKFATCRLFPFNRVFRAGAVRVVDFNSVVCPLRDALGSGQGVSHRELSDELAAVGDGPLTGSPAPLPDGARELRWHALEQGLVEASQAVLSAPSYLPYAIEQLSRTQHHLGLRASEGELASEQKLTALLSSWGEIYGWPAASETVRVQTTRRMALLTPSLRFNALFRRGGPAYREAVLRLPRQLMAGWFLAAHAASAFVRPEGRGDGALGDSALSLRGVTELYQAQAGLRDLLAQLDQPARLTAPLVTSDLPAELSQAASKLDRALQRPAAGGAATALATTLAGLARDLPPDQRALLPAVLLRAGEALRFG